MSKNPVKQIGHIETIKFLLKSGKQDAAQAYIHCLDDDEFIKLSEKINFLVDLDPDWYKKTLKDQFNDNPKAKEKVGIVENAILTRTEVLAEPDANTVKHQIHLAWRTLGKELI